MKTIFCSSANEYETMAEEYIRSFDEKYAKRIKYIEDSMGIFLRNYYGYLPTAGEMEWPVLEPNFNITETRFVSFNEAWSYGITDCIVYFYIEDSQFMRVFRNPDKYMSFLKECKGVVGPDMSQYTDMPAEMRYRHAFCNMLLSSILQNEGANLYPNITWSKQDSFVYSFPQNLSNSVIAINSNGVHRNGLTLFRWKTGYEMALDRLAPIHILRYGEKVMGENIQISSYHVNERLKDLKDGSKRK